MVWRILALIVAAPFVLALCLIVLAYLTLNSGPGRDFLFARIEPAAEKALGGDIDIGGFGGTWPHEIILKDVALSDANGEWARAKRLSVAWAPFSSLSGRIIVDEARLDGARLTARPVFPDRAGGGGGGVPPAVLVRRFVIEDFQAADDVVSGGARLNMSGAVSTRRIRPSRLRFAFVADGGAAGQTARLSVQDGVFDGGLVQGAVEAMVETPEGAPDPWRALAGETARLAFTVDGRLDGMLTMTGLQVWAADETVLLEASAGLGLAPLIVETEGRLSATALQRASAGLEPGGPLLFSLAAARRDGAMTLTGEAAAPASVYNGAAAPALKADFDFSDIAAPAGALKLTALDDGGAALGEVSANLSTPEASIIRVSDIEARYATAMLSGAATVARSPLAVEADMRLDAPALQDLPLPVENLSGDVAAAARIVYDDAGLSVALNVVSDLLSAASATASGVKAQASGPLEGLSVAVSAAQVASPAGLTENLQADISVVRDGGVLALTPRLMSFRQDDVEVALKDGGALRLGNGAVRLAPSVVSVGPGRLAVEGAYGGAGVEGEAVFDNVPVADRGALTGRVSLKAAADSGDGAVDLRFAPRPDAVTALALDVEGAWTGAELLATGYIEGVGDDIAYGRTQVLRLAAPLRFDFSQNAPRPVMEGPFSLAAVYDGDIAPWAALSGLDDLITDGRLVVDMKLDGPLDRLSASGGAVFSGGVLDHPQSGIRLTDIDARTDVSGVWPQIDLAASLQASDGDVADGRPPISAELNIDDLGGDGALDGRIVLAKARLLRREEAEGVLSADLAFGGTVQAAEVRGDVRVDRLDATIPEAQAESVVDVDIRTEDDAADDIAPPPDAPPVVLDLRVRADDKMFLRGRGLTSEWKTNLAIRGPAAAPRLDGSASAVRGSLLFAGRRFTLTKSDIVFTPFSGYDPLLDIAAETTASDDVKAIIAVTGRASDPEISLQSEPALPQEDVMARVLFGKPASELTAIESVQIARAIASLTGSGPFGGGGGGILEDARQSLGLDMVQLNAENSDAAGLTVGKYVADGVFVSATQDVNGDAGAVSVEVDLTKRIRVETTVGQDASGSVSLNWTKDY